MQCVSMINLRDDTGNQKKEHQRSLATETGGVPSPLRGIIKKLERANTNNFVAYTANALYDTFQLLYYYYASFIVICHTICPEEG